MCNVHDEKGERRPYFARSSLVVRLCDVTTLAISASRRGSEQERERVIGAVFFYPPMLLLLLPLPTEWLALVGVLQLTFYLRFQKRKTVLEISS